MLEAYFKELDMNHLARLFYKSDQKFWHYANNYYNAGKSPDAGFQMERWRRINYMIHDEMYSEDRIKSNA